MTEPAYRQAGYLGAGLIRGLVTRDGNLVLSQGDPSWDRYDRFVNTTLAHDFQPYLTLTYKPYDWGGGATLNMPSLQEFAYYCRFTAQHFLGRVHDYSVWNEPNHFKLPDGNGNLTTVPAAYYGQLFRACYGEIKSVDPSAKVYFGELAGGNCNYLTTAVSSSNTSADGFAVHPYQWHLAPELPLSTGCSGIGRLGDWSNLLYNTWMAGWFHTPAGGPVPLMVTEFGYCVAGGGCPEAPHTMSEAQRADWIGRAYDVAQSSGAALFSYYGLVKTGSGWDTGIVEQNGERHAVRRRAPRRDRCPVARRDDKRTVRGGRAPGDAERHRQPARDQDQLPLRVRNDDELRAVGACAGRRRRVRDEFGGGQTADHGPLSAHDLPLPPGRDEPGGEQLEVAIRRSEQRESFGA